MQNLLNYIAERTFCSPELNKAIESSFELVAFNKNDHVLTEGLLAHYLYFIDKGMLHNYHNNDGKKVSSWFYYENQFVTAWSSFYTRKPSFETIECIEDCKLYRISYKDYQKLIVDYPAFGNFARTLAEEILAIIDEFSKNWAFLSAKEKYVLLNTYFPKIELRVKLGLIASFLGISQETLSRIRAEK